MIKKIEGWPYYIDEEGHVFDMDGNSPSKWMQDGKPFIWLRDGERASRRNLAKLTWTAFRGEIPIGMCVSPVNGKYTDTRLVNLELKKNNRRQNHDVGDGPEMPPIKDIDVNGAMNLLVAAIRQAAKDSKSKNAATRQWSKEYLYIVVPKMLDIQVKDVDRIVEHFTGRKRVRQLRKPKEVRDRERCKTCRYRQRLGHNVYSMSTICGYSTFTGKMRNSSPETCDKYERGESLAYKFANKGRAFRA